jgi:hypothetical protein
LLFPLLPSPTFPSQRRKARHTPHFSPFLFMPLRTLSFPVSCNSFVCHSYENTGVYPNSSHSGTRSTRLPGFVRATSHESPITNPFVFTLFHTLLRSSKSQLVSFQGIPHSFTKTPGGGVPPRPYTLRGQGGNLYVPRELLSECGHPRLKPQKRNGTDIDVCPTNREWCCVRQLRLDWKRDCHSLVGQVIYS